MRFLLSFCLIFAASSATAQTHVKPTHDHVDRPIVDRSAAAAGTTKLVRLAMTDYEVWVAEDASKNQSFTLFLETKDGWFEATESVTFPHTQVRVFGSEREAEEYVAMSIAGGLDVLDYRVIPHTPDTDWVYVETFDSRAEALAFLEILLDAFGDDYVGDVRAVTVIPKALR